MDIVINDSRRICDIQEEFQREFPFLKIEFFRNFHHKGEPSPKSQLIAGTMTLAFARNIHNEGSIMVSGSRLVEEIENDFQNKFGISAQIFRKSGNLWIETSLTDHWSLMRQNHEGHQMSKPDTRSRWERIKDEQVDKD